MALSQEQVNGTYKHILDIILGGLDAGDLEAYEASEIAEFIVGKVEALEGENSVNDFYSQVAELWPFMEALLEEKNAEDQEKMETEKLEGALSLLKHGKVDDALNIVKSQDN